MIEARRTAADQDARLLDGMLARVAAAVQATSGADLTPAETARWASIVLRERRGLYSSTHGQSLPGAAAAVTDPTERRLIGLDSADGESTATETRELELIRLDRLQAALWPDAMTGDTTAARTILRVMDRRARLLGLDTAKTIKTVLTTELDERIAALTERMRLQAAQGR
ncbi:hypothetical protein AB0F17_28625 [Nonomuraea sp. NPDC026600]|uniref:hypothetical protein n=1 Tax=Nonomuraea sp. NPDC026600 TaxID=3155363 RepID=UPI0033C398CC